MATYIYMKIDKKKAWNPASLLDCSIFEGDGNCQRPGKTIHLYLMDGMEEGRWQATLSNWNEGKLADGTFLADVHFKSLSGAACCILGRSANG